MTASPSRTRRMLAPRSLVARAEAIRRRPLVARERVRTESDNASFGSSSSLNAKGRSRVAPTTTHMSRSGRPGSECRTRTPRSSSASQSVDLMQTATPIEGERPVTFAADGSRRRHRLCRVRRRRADDARGASAGDRRPRALARTSLPFRARCQSTARWRFDTTHDLERHPRAPSDADRCRGEPDALVTGRSRGQEPRRAERRRSEPVRATGRVVHEPGVLRAARRASCRMAALGRSPGGWRRLRARRSSARRWTCRRRPAGLEAVHGSSVRS